MGPELRSRLFWQLALPLLTAANVALAVADLVVARWGGGLSWAQVVGGAFCCAVGGFLIGAAAAHTFWRAAAEQQARRWRGLFDVLLKLSEVARLDTATLRAVKEEAEEALRKEA